MIMETEYEVVGFIKKECVCEKCNKLMTKSSGMLMSNPPQYEYRCEKCGKVEYVNCEDLDGQLKLVKKVVDIEMTDIERINKDISCIKNTGKISDGYHTFDELYHHRAVLFAMICNQNKHLAWKSKLHNTGDMYEGMFIVGIRTPYGQVTYHYDLPYWDIFKVEELEKAPEWDGSTPNDCINRMQQFSEYIINNNGNPNW